MTGASVELSTRRVVVSSLTLATTGMLPVFVAGAVAVQMSADLGYGTPGIGLSTAAFYAAAMVVSVSLGRLADRVGWKLACSLSVSASVLVLAAIALAGASLAQVALLLALGGIANALLQPSVNLFLARRAPAEGRGLVFGLKQAAIPLATMLGGVSVPAIAVTLGWRWAFAAAAGFGLVAVAFIPWRAQAEPAPPPETSPSDAGGRMRGLGPLTVVTLLGQTGSSVLASFLVVSAVAAGIRPDAAGVLLAAVSLLGIASRITLGWWADHRPLPGFRVIAVMLALGAVGSAVLAVPNPAAVVVGAVLAYVAGWGWPGLFNLLVVSRFDAAPARATAVTQVGVYAGSGAGPLMFGIVASWSFVAAWLLSAGMLAAAAVIAAGIEGSWTPAPVVTR